VFKHFFCVFRISAQVRPHAQDQTIEGVRELLSDVEAKKKIAQFNLFAKGFQISVFCVVFAMMISQAGFPIATQHHRGERRCWCSGATNCMERDPRKID
jgi:hypothetical protein